MKENGQMSIPRREGGMAPPESLLARVRGEYQEIPGLRLTLAQASRFLQIEASACEALLEQLVRERVLLRTETGCYITAPSVDRQAKAPLGKRAVIPRSA
jgi:hypothetical protein